MTQDEEVQWVEKRRVIGALSIAAWSCIDPLAKLHWADILLTQVDAMLRWRLGRLVPPDLENLMYGAVKEYVEAYLRTEKYHKAASAIEPDDWDRTSKLQTLNARFDEARQRIVTVTTQYFAPEGERAIPEEHRNEVATILRDLKRLRIARGDWYAASNQINPALIYQEYVDRALVPVTSTLQDIISIHGMSLMGDDQLTSVISVSQGFAAPSKPGETGRGT